MKKLISLFLIILIAFSLYGCISQKKPYSSIYDGKKVLRIETSYGGGHGMRRHVRTFDFEHGVVTDTIEYMGDYTDADESGEYNDTEELAAFTAEQGQELIDNITILGFFFWEEQYRTKNIIYDGSSKLVYVLFADGTEKNTVIYYKDPPKYKAICKAFEDTFGVSL
ncbi:MAG: hypothetical protein J1G04_05380 [Clostridiales bacterium]|nr:hypothetical protein [Clostridiales bacterium]